MKIYQYNYLIICLHNYADTMTAFKDTVRLCIKVPYTLLTWSFPGLESINSGLERPLYYCVFHSKIFCTADYFEGSENVIHLLHWHWRPHRPIKLASSCFTVTLDHSHMVGIEDFRKIISGRKKKGLELMLENNES